ncbi:PepSY domain-containing protein [Parasphingorhabdus flavimaris]|uniref:PepSY domain-containing protein n=1 Tax=Parasphingorhabdus flavimaris TaxID=266812 RepID=A0ABX2N4A5_9SPHN|nr:PepSY-associated TM helix domain-containing protein [Parasphingorhabdus flavimaris]NVD28551.1 PepSY domain-containing protein [Parasphingorhabdus flavimaris]|tara:strand:+ start:3206 stop:4516 length:1311 start_codon:yes stop_codon:yes gene_type:complete
MNAIIEPATVKKALSAHAAIGLVAGALLYIVSLTGTVAVFYQELQRVEQPNAPEMASIAPEAVQRGVEAVLASEAGQPSTTHLYVHLPDSELPRTTVTTDTQAVHLAQDGSIAGPEQIAWSDFLVKLHYTLNLPTLVGITIVGILGVMMLALAVSGVVAHPRIFRDAFRLRARNDNGVGLADWHNRLSVWTLPFSVAIALTGALIGLATITAYGIAADDYDGDVEAVYGPIFGEEGEADPRPAAVPDVAAVLAHMAREYPAVRPTYAILHDPLTMGQHVQIVGEHDQRLIFGEYYGFNADGGFTHVAGLADGEWGQQAAASTYQLHFGTFGGLAVKLAYLLFGVALTAICATGTYIWLGKRRRRGIEEPGLRGAWHGVIIGTPLALAITLSARLVMGNDFPFAITFWIVLAVAVAGGAEVMRRNSVTRIAASSPTV